MFARMLCISVLLLTQSAQAADTCASFAARAVQDWGPPANCYCGASLAKVKLHLPGSLKLAAACKMYKDHGQAGREQLLPHKDLLDLDHYDKQGNYPGGMIFLRGTLELSGVVRFSNGMDDIAGFSAQQLVRENGGKSVLANTYLYRGIYFTARQMRQLRPPKASSDAYCFERSARLRFTDFDIKSIDTHEDGSTPRQVEVLSLGSLKPC